VTVVPRVLLEHVHQDPPQRDRPFAGFVADDVVDVPDEPEQRQRRPANGLLG
jgi:hypothetical protein